MIYFLIALLVEFVIGCANPTTQSDRPYPYPLGNYPTERYVSYTMTCVDAMGNNSLTADCTISTWGTATEEFLNAPSGWEHKVHYPTSPLRISARLNGTGTAHVEIWTYEKWSTGQVVTNRLSHATVTGTNVTVSARGIW
jgi:hypothetical protein